MYQLIVCYCGNLIGHLADEVFLIENLNYTTDSNRVKELIQLLYKQAGNDQAQRMLRKFILVSI